MGDDETIRIFVGADRSQKLAIDVLEYSIRRHTQARVQIIPMVDLAVPEPKDPRNWQRTGFSYSRFCIPKLAGYSGKAIYMDADMQVFKDITRLWELPLNGAKVLIQSELKHLDTTMEKKNAPAQRIKQVQSFRIWMLAGMAMKT
jgi:lipopolysaccharide biosynthesis glycosyltransferase